MATDSQSSDSDDYGAFLEAKKKETGKTDKHHSTKYRVVWEQDYPWLRAYTSNTSYAICTLCESVFNICHGGVHDIKRHQDTAKHKKRMITSSGAENKEQQPAINKIQQNDGDSTLSDNSLCKNEPRSKQRKSGKIRKQYFLTYDKSWEKQHPWIKSNVDSAYAECRICESVFSIDYRGIHDVVRHMERVKHKKALELKGIDYANFDGGDNLTDHNNSEKTMEIARKRNRKRIKIEQQDTSLEESSSALYWDTFMNDSKMESTYHSDSSSNSINPFESIDIPNEIENQLHQFDPLWKQQFTWLQKCEENSSHAKCIICKTSFSIAFGGIADLHKHEKDEQHKLKIRKCNRTKPPYVVRPIVKREPDHKELVKSNSRSLMLFAYHKIRHSIGSIDCTTPMTSDSNLQNVLKQENVIKIVKEVLAPFTQKSIIKDLSNNHPFAICTDLRYLDDSGTFPLILRYFKNTNGVQNKLLTFVKSTSDSPQDVYDSIINELNSIGLSVTNATAFVSNNSKLSYGNSKSVYSELKKQNRFLLPIKCIGSDLQTAALKAQHDLQFDIEILIYKCFNELSASDSVIIPDELQELCKWVRHEWSVVLSKVPLNYCAIVEAASRVLSNFSALKTFFANTEFAPRILVDFFRFEFAACYLSLFKNVVSTFQSTYVRLMCSEKSSAIDLYDIMNELRNSLIVKRNEDIYESIVRHVLPLSTDCNTTFFDQFRKEAYMCFDTAIEQLNRGFDFEHSILKPLSSLRLLQRQPCYDDLHAIVTAFHINGIVNTELADEAKVLITYYQANRLFSVENSAEAAAKWWLELFKVHNLVNIERICAHVFSLPLANVMSPRICMELQSVSKLESKHLAYHKAEIVIRENFAAHMTCQECISYLNTSTGNELLLNCQKFIKFQ